MMPMPRKAHTLPIRVLIPSFVTVLALCAGLTSMRLAIDGRYSHAMLMILLAALLDGLDGRVARMLKGTSQFGAELDSLADFFNFGIAPAMLVYLALLQDYGRFGWLAVMLLAVACALRLARFNVAAHGANKGEWTRNYFTGVPAPASGCLALLPVLLMLEGWTGVAQAPLLVSGYLIFVAFLTFSRIPTFAAKHVRVRRDLLLPVFGLFAALVALLATNTWLTLTLLDLTYLLSIPIAARSYKRKEKLFRGANGAKTEDRIRPRG